MRSIDDFPLAEQQALYERVLARISAGSEETFLRESLKPTNHKTKNYSLSYQQNQTAAITPNTK
ncbi:hypothetical protein J4402_02270 [Candidatus Pacearchaeota archaeon]|nr:hypothetical protein [uncultured archaeon]AQS31885.1 hypothetical protein [uncultured archaeon]MBS3088583.1 hypothetical protein [Candidatus Pacearchaeota archaeon]